MVPTKVGRPKAGPPLWGWPKAGPLWVGIALFLSHLANNKTSCKELRNSYPNYFMSKNKIQLTPEINVDNILKEVVSIHDSRRNID